jgi:hypothetical protein
VAKQPVRKALWSMRHPVTASKVTGRIIVIYTMGRVGTVSTRKAIAQTVPYTQLEVAHYLTSDGIAHGEAFRVNADKRSRRIRALLTAEDSPYPLFISLVRDPVARDASFIMKQAQVGRYNRADGESLTTADLEREFVNQGPDDSVGWMERELGTFLDFDVYATPFDREEGYQIYELKRGKLLILRIDDLSRAFSAAMTQFVGCPFSLPTVHNSGKTGPMGGVTSRFSEALVLDGGLLDQYYTSRFARHFYTEAELAKFRAKWDGHA